MSLQRKLTETDGDETSTGQYDVFGIRNQVPHGPTSAYYNDQNYMITRKVSYLGLGIPQDVSCVFYWNVEKLSVMAPDTILFDLAVIAPSSGSSDNAIKTVQRAYHTVFGRDVPAIDRDNYLVHWTQVCSSPGVPDSIVQELRQILPSLPDLTWKNVAPMVGLDPSRGEELSRKRMQILYFPDKFVDKIMDFARWRIFWSERRQYVQLGSFVSVIAPHHCLLLTSEVKAVKMVLNKIGFGYEKIQSESSFNLEVKIVHNAALLMFESELWHDQTQMLAQAIAEVTCMLLNIQIPVLISVRSGGVK